MDYCRPTPNLRPLPECRWGEIIGSEPGAPLWGYADLHAHLMAHLAVWREGLLGRALRPGSPGEEGMPTALGSCAQSTAALINRQPGIRPTRPAVEWPEFIIWPAFFTTLIHQQAYIDWIYRAYQGGGCG